MPDNARTCLAVRHVPFEDLGFFADVLAGRGFAIAYCDAATEDLTGASLRDCDLLVLLGGPIGVYERDAYPFIDAEIALAEARLAAGRPLLGICLGSQMMAAALGAQVYSGNRGKEIGWAPLSLSADGQASPLGHLAPERTRVLHWHGDSFDLPKDATLLASTERYRHQAFSYGDAALALQFHAEVTAKGLERWFVGHACEIAATPGVDVAGLRAATARYAPALLNHGRAFFEAWLARAGLG
jgi:GMP synthase (glutamine-hydrolysing)